MGGEVDCTYSLEKVRTSRTTRRGRRRRLGRRSALLLSATSAVVASFFAGGVPLVCGMQTPGTSAFVVVVPGAGTYASSPGGRSRPSFRPSMSADEVPPAAKGLTTGSGEVQRGGAGADPESDLFIPTSFFATTEAEFATALAGRGNFGDIMGGVEGKGTNLLRHFDPLERVALTANGNLQRIISSYYDSPVTVEIKGCKEVEPFVYDREVTLSVLGSEFCVAKSVVVLHSTACVEAVQGGGVGIGQLFRSLDILPSFELLNAGRQVGPSKADAEETPEGRPSRGGGIWRVYDLRSRHVSCRIHEEFSPGLFGLLAP